MAEPIAVLLADDHPVVLEGLTRYLGRQDDVRVCGTATSEPEALDAVRTHRPDVIVLDVKMPGMRGVETVRELVELQPAPRVVIFSMNEEDDFAVSLLRAGAMAYLNKSSDPRELADAIRVAHRGRRYLTPGLSARLFEGRVGAPPHESLSPREREVFDLLVRGVAAKTIAKRLELAVSTVHTYTERIKIKLDLDTTAQLVRYAFQQGLA